MDEVDDEVEAELSPVQKCAVLFAAQHGHATDRQVRAAGISWKRQRTWIDHGLRVRVHPGVLAVAGTPRTWQTVLTAALLAVPGAVACGRSAARVHSLDGFRRYSG